MISIIKRRSRLGIIAIFISIIMFSAGCMAYRYVTPYKTYDHDQHEMALLDKDKDCFVCHKVDINEPDLQKRLEMLKASLKQTTEKQFEREMCHNCHLDGRIVDYQIAPKNCKFCHEDLIRIIPDTHDNLWKENHNLQAKVSEKYCMRCHDRWYCNDCHTSSELKRANMHPRTFRVSHIAAVMADPGSCSSCHRNSFCIDCHTTK